MTNPITCCSSDAISVLNAWRNDASSRTVLVGKSVVTELGLALLATTALVETVAWAAFTALSILVLPCDTEPFKFFASLVASSAFTTLWALTSVLFFNIFARRLDTSESDARGSALRMLCCGEEERAAPAPVNPRQINPGQNARPAVSTPNPAADVIVEVVKSFSLETRTLFEEWESAVLHLMLAKVAYTYAFGTKKKEAIPAFFTAQTKEGIQQLRAMSPSSNALETIEAQFQCWDLTLATATNPSEADTLKIPDKATQDLFTKIRNTGAYELQSAFSKTDTGEAIRRLTTP